MYVEGEGEPGGRDRERRGRGRERRGNEGSGTESDHRRCGYRSPLPRSGFVQHLAELPIRHLNPPPRHLCLPSAVGSLTTRVRG